MPAIVDFQPYMGKVRRPGTGCISQINDHLFEGRYSPTWIDGKKHARNVYAHTREECEEKLKVLIAETKANVALQYTVAVRDKLIDGYKEIMQMSI